MEKTFTKEEVDKFRDEFYDALIAIGESKRWATAEVGRHSDDSIRDVMPFHTPQSYAKMMTM